MDINDTRWHLLWKPWDPFLFLPIIFTSFFMFTFFDPLNPNLIPQWRTLIADFAIIISIMVFCALDYLMSLETPKLHVPTEIKVTQLSFCVIIIILKKRFSLIILPLLEWIWDHIKCIIYYCSVVVCVLNAFFFSYFNSFCMIVCLLFIFLSYSFL